jgi:AcrR family transcriptional regulator
MPYRRTEKVARKRAARHQAIIEAAAAAARDGGLAALRMAPVAARAGVAAGTVYRYFPSKADLVTELTAAVAAREIAALEAAADAAPGPLSALAAAVATFATRALARKRLVFAMIAEPTEPAIASARQVFRTALVAAFERRIQAALAGAHLPDQDAAVSAGALTGALIEGVLGPHASDPAGDRLRARASVQTLTLFGLRALGVVDARARGLVVQTKLPADADLI